MKKRTLKLVSKVFALFVALAIFAGNGAMVSAASCSEDKEGLQQLAIFAGNGAMRSVGTCPGDKEGLHHYEAKRYTGEGYTDFVTHAHHTGYDVNGQETYITCQVAMHYRYFYYVCRDCGATGPGGRQTEHYLTTHSVDQI